MKRINLFISDENFDFLKTHSETTLSEHIRWALANYIHKIRQEEIRIKVSASESKRREVDKNGSNS
jgi:hypothetical protein